MSSLASMCGPYLFPDFEPEPDPSAGYLFPPPLPLLLPADTRTTRGSLYRRKPNPNAHDPDQIAAIVAKNFGLRARDLYDTSRKGITICRARNTLAYILLTQGGWSERPLGNHPGFRRDRLRHQFKRATQDPYMRIILRNLKPKLPEPVDTPPPPGSSVQPPPKGIIR